MTVVIIFFQNFNAIGCVSASTPGRSKFKFLWLGRCDPLPLHPHPLTAPDPPWITGEIHNSDVVIIVVVVVIVVVAVDAELRGLRGFGLRRGSRRRALRRALRFRGLAGYSTAVFLSLPLVC